MTDRRLRGDTTSAMLVHSLAMTLADRPDADIMSVDLVHGARAGQTIRRVTARGSDLRALVSNALAPSTLKGIIRNHPALHQHDGDVLIVDLD